MSNTAFDQRLKDQSTNGSANNHKMDKQNYGIYGANKQVIQNAPGGQQPIGMRVTGIPESYVSGPYYQTTNTGFPMSFPNFNQPTWSTGNSNQPYEPNNFGFGTINAGGPPPTENQYVQPPDHLFNQNNPAYNTTYSGAYMNGNNVGSWSYFNSPNSFFFPTGNADLNLTWGQQQEAAQNNQLLPDVYKGPITQHHDIENGAANPPLANNISDPNTVQPNTETETSIEQQISGLNISAEIEPTKNGDESEPKFTSAPTGQSTTHSTTNAVSNAPAKPISWAAVAKQPAKPKPASAPRPQQKTTSHNQSKPVSHQNGVGNKNSGRQQQNNGRLGRQNQNSDNGKYTDSLLTKDSSPLLKKLCADNNYNPKEFTLNSKDARVFIIKSYSEDDIFRSIKYSIWTSTEHGNRRLNEAYKEQCTNGQYPIYLLFSVNGSGHFCGIALMKSEVDCSIETGIWVQDKWKGRFEVKWVYVKDVPNMSLRHIRLENNENKPVTNSRDTQEVPLDKAKQVLKIIHTYKAQTSIFDDFSHYEKRQLEDAKARGRDLDDVESH